jgi:hypothetical protein
VGSDGGVAAGALAGNIATLRPRVERPLELRNRLLIRCAHNRASIQYVCFVPILLQKSFWGGERKFLEPLMPFAHGDVRDHIVSFRIDHGPP